MPLKTVFKTILAGLIAGIIVYWFFNDPPSEVRSLSSLSSTGQRLKWGKVGKPMDLRIRNLKDISVVENKEIKLRGFLTLKQNIAEEIDYRWVLPKDAHIVAGEETGSFRKLASGKEVSTDITIALPDDYDENLVVAFEAYYVSNGARVANSAVYTPTADVSTEKNEALKIQGEKEEALPPNIQM